MHYFPDILATICIFSSGLMYGFYFKSVEMFMGKFNKYWPHWHAVTSMGICIVVASIITIKKVRDRCYKFEQFYVIFIGISCFIICGCFLLDQNSNAAFYFGMAGHGINHIPIYSYISMRASNHGYRPTKIALANTLYATGLAVGFSTFMDLNINTLATIGLHENGWTILGAALILMSGIIINEILQLTQACNYKKSRDPVWNVCNDRGVLFQNEKSLRSDAQRCEWSKSLTGRNRQKFIVISLFFTIIERSLAFGLVFMGIGTTSGMTYTGNFNYYAPFIFYAVGCGIGCFLLIWFQSKNVQLLFGLIKIAASTAILVIYTETNVGNCYPFICLYFLSMGVYSSVPIQSILESAPLKYTEMIFGLGYVFEYIIIEALKYDIVLVKTYGLKNILLADGVWFSVVTLISIVLVQVCSQKSDSLIEIRNRLIGLKVANFVPRSRVWNSWAYGRETPSICSNITTVRLNGNKIYQQYAPN